MRRIVHLSTRILILAFLAYYGVACGEPSTPPAPAQVLTFKFYQKDNSELGLDSVVGNINESEKTIAVTVPYGTNLTALRPTITLSKGASVSPTSGEAKDFTKPVTYTLTAADGKTKVAYTVMTVVATAPQLFSFKFYKKNNSALTVDSVVGTIDEHAKTVVLVVPYGTDITVLEPTITFSKGASVSPVGPFVFTRPVTYTLTAADGKTGNNYKVTVIFVPKVLTFSFKKTQNSMLGIDEVVGTIDEHAKTISLTIPYGTNVEALKPTITTNEIANVSPASGDAKDFTKPVLYTLTAADGKTKVNYTVNVNVVATAQLLTFSFNKTQNSALEIDEAVGNINESKKTITVMVPYGTNLTALRPTITFSKGASVSPTSGEAKDFTHPVTYTLTEADGKTKSTYSVAVTFPLVMKWRTNTNNEQIKLPLVQSGSYDCIVDWGDGSKQHITTWSDYEMRHTYATAGEHTVVISGKIEGWSFGESNYYTTINRVGNDYADPNAERLLEVLSWGYLVLGNTSGGQFVGAKNVRFPATGAPDVSKTTSLKYAFANATNFNSPLNDWDVSKVTNMEQTFSQATAFNQPINKWNVASVTTMRSMFLSAHAFNQSINDWDVSKVTDMEYVFYDATAFNQPLNDWNVSSVTTMMSMFEQARAFNQPLNKWNVVNVVKVWEMFRNAVAFNQDLSAWNAPNVTNCFGFYLGANAWTLPKPWLQKCTP